MTIATKHKYKACFGILVSYWGGLHAPRSKVYLSETYEIKRYTTQIKLRTGMPALNVSVHQMALRAIEKRSDKLNSGYVKRSSNSCMWTFLDLQQHCCTFLTQSTAIWEMDDEKAFTISVR